MLRRVFCKLLLVVVAVFGLFVISGVLSAQGNREWAFERVKEVQEMHTERLMALKGVEGTAIGLDENGRLAIAVFTAGPAVPGIPRNLEGVPVQVVVAGKFYALQKSTKIPPGLAKKPPKAPTGLTATAVSENQINLSWTDNANNETGFKIERKTTGSFSVIAMVGANETSYCDTSLSSSTTYTYRVYAYNSSGASDYSNEASATTKGGPVEPPVAPTNLTATAVSSSQINLDWTDNANNETGFEIERGSVLIGMVGANVTSYSDTGLDPSTTYTYRVLAYNDADDSDYSKEASATTEPPPEKPPLWCERPVPIGVSTGHPDITAGTIGCRVKDTSGNVYALSNNHVYADENNADFGDPVLQPGPYDGGTLDDEIGTLYDFEPIVFHPRAYNEIDAAIALSSTGDLGNATPDGTGYGTPSTETVEATLGMAVQKYGRTTGLTSGVVAYVNVAVKVGYDSGTARFVNQIVISPGTFSDGGDSGSLVVTDDSNYSNCKAVGLLFAGSSSYTIANPINEVLTQLGVTIDGVSP